MNFNTLRQVISKAIDKQLFTKSKTDEGNITNKIICGCLLYEILLALVSHDSQYASGISSIADAYAANSKSTAESLEGKYLSYKSIKKVISENNITSFLSITRKQIEEILDLYHDKRVIEEFSTTRYSSKMYAVHKLTFSQDRYLAKIHNKVILPIVDYYKNIRGIKNSDVVVENIIDNNPGKTINLSISGISSLQIITDLSADRVGISQYLYSVKLTEDNYAQITMK